MRAKLWRQAITPCLLAPHLLQGRLPEEVLLCMRDVLRFFLHGQQLSYERLLVAGERLGEDLGLDM